jgi:hypothetical protein
LAGRALAHRSPMASSPTLTGTRRDGRRMPTVCTKPESRTSRAGTTLGQEKKQEEGVVLREERRDVDEVEARAVALGREGEGDPGRAEVEGGRDEGWR